MCFIIQGDSAILSVLFCIIAEFAALIWWVDNHLFYSFRKCQILNRIHSSTLNENLFTYESLSYCILSAIHNMIMFSFHQGTQFFLFHLLRKFCSCLSCTTEQCNTHSTHRMPCQQACVSFCDTPRGLKHVGVV